VEGSAPSETEEPTSNISVRRVGNVGALATVKRKLEKWMMVVHLDRLAPNQEAARDGHP
jgi:hypothetical protein